ncbi:MAG: MerR family transcriptional regulator [Clostridia bacterium]|nr:MerR family transcriptional regulator [Clostridia bacterium]
MTIKEVSEKYEIPADTLRYYEKVGAIPPVTRTASGIRDYSEDDIAWVELAKCMRAAGLPVNTLVEYLKLFKQGDSTFFKRLELLKKQKTILLQQQQQIAETIAKLDYKISLYENTDKISDNNKD